MLFAAASLSLLILRVFLKRAAALVRECVSGPESSSNVDMEKTRAEKGVSIETYLSGSLMCGGGCTGQLPPVSDPAAQRYLLFAVEWSHERTCILQMGQDKWPNFAWEKQNVAPKQNATTINYADPEILIHLVERTAINKNKIYKMCNFGIVLLKFNKQTRNLIL